MYILLTENRYFTNCLLLQKKMQIFHQSDICRWNSLYGYVYTMQQIIEIYKSIILGLGYFWCLEICHGHLWRDAVA